VFAKKFFCDLADNHYRQYLHGGGDGSNHHWLKPKYFARLAMAYWRMVLGYAMNIRRCAIQKMSRRMAMAVVLRLA
jgi:hypothetical protein